MLVITLQSSYDTVCKQNVQYRLSNEAVYCYTKNLVDMFVGKNKM